MLSLAKIGFSSLLICSIISCDKIPRGAPMTAEVLRDNNSSTNNYSLHKVDSAFFDSNIAVTKRQQINNFNWNLKVEEEDHIQIKSGDTINLEVWDGADNSLITPVGQKRTLINNSIVSDAGVFVPYIGVVNVISLTPDVARTKIQDSLSKVVPSAQVSLTVTPGVNNSVKLINGFKRSGMISLEENRSSILSIIASAGGVDPSIKFPILTVTRDGTQHTIFLDDLYDDPQKDIILKGGDKLVVRNDRRYFLSLGATGKETLIPFNQKSISALDAVSMFGGISNQTGNPGGILIFRVEGEVFQDRTTTGEQKRHDIYALNLTNADGIFSAKKFQIQHQDLILVTDSEVTTVGTALKFLGSFTRVSFD